jgi:uncharacterized membrane protein
MALLVGWSVASGYFWIQAPVLIVYFITVFPLRKRIKEVWYDERNAIIDLRAQGIASAIFVFLSIGTGAILLYLSLSAYPDLAPIGLTLASSGAVLVLFFHLVKLYISRKMGSKV